ncbi:MAG: electron transfer flavoprotein subunit alpha/FixB family protein [Bacteroidota bacterium]|nr:electron transfer flavoprotein subunit alpha/FixB family protein [Bacteroidota bacterium]
MSVLVYTENWEGKFKKLSFELLSYASEIAAQINTQVVALSIGQVAEDELKKLGNYGASKIVSVDYGNGQLDNQVYTSAIAQLAEKEDASIIVLSDNFTGKALAPRISAKLKAGLVSGAIALPASYDPFVVKKKAFTGKTFVHVKVNSDKKVISLTGNSAEIKETENKAVIENITLTLADAKTTVEKVDKLTGQILLTDAEVVVSGGRGMKSGDNWGPLEEFAGVLGAATACSRPVSDEEWRPHHEHVGQTGKIIAPNLYFALGISGAIQHIAGVSGSKILVAVNKDPDAPVFEVADYGIVGDVNKILPQFIEAAKELKANS